MKPILITPFLVLALLFTVAAQDSGLPSIQRPELTTAQREAMEELNLATQSYREGKFAEAQLHSEKALALDPSNKTAPLFIARTIHAQYKPGDQSEANVAKAREAISAYQTILVQNSHNEEAYKAIAYLYAALKDEELLREWIFRRAIDPTFPDEERAEAYTVLASKAWDCSYKITETSSQKFTTIDHNNRVEVHYNKPSDPAEFKKAQRCATEGLEMVEVATTLDPNNEAAWSYKTNLLLELAKLSEMDHDLQLKIEYTNQSNAAQRTTVEIWKRKASNPVSKP